MSTYSGRNSYEPLPASAWQTGTMLPYVAQFALSMLSPTEKKWLFSSVLGAVIGGGLGAWTFSTHRILGALVSTFPGAIAGFIVGRELFVTRNPMDALSPVYPGPIGRGENVSQPCLSTDEQKQAAMLACMKAANCLTTEEYRKLEASNGQPLPEMLGKPCFFPCMEGVEAKACPGT